MGFFRDGDELQAELCAFLGDFVASDAAARAAAETGFEGVLVLRTVNPESAVSLDVSGRRVSSGAVDNGAVELELEADDLHHILLNRLGPVEISRLYETDCVRFAGRPEALGAVALLAGRVQQFYPDSLMRRGRQDLLDTPAPATGDLWDVGGPPKEVIGKRRPWQRPTKAASSS